MKPLYYFCAVLLAYSVILSSMQAQTFPNPGHNLSSGDFFFGDWASTNSAGTYPPFMAFHRTANNSAVDPPLSADMPVDYTGAYNGTSGVRINGLGTDGISFVNTSSVTSGQLGGAVAVMNATGRSNIQISFVCGLLAQGDGSPIPREFGIQLQYRIGSSGVWNDVSGALYSSLNKTVNSSESLGPFTLPVETNNEPIIQLRFKYHSIAANNGGQRPRIRLDDITVSSVSAVGIATRLAITSITPASPSTASSFSAVVQSVNSLGNPTNVTMATSFVLSRSAGSGTLGGVLTGTIPANQNTAVVTGITYNVAENGVIVQAARTSGENLSTGQSPPFTVSAGAVMLSFVNLQDKAYVGKTLRTFSVETRRADNTVDPNFVGSATLSVVSGPGSIVGTATKNFVNGVASFNDIRFSADGIYVIRAVTTGLTQATSTTIAVNPRITMTEILIPKNIKSTSNLTRVPAWACVQFNNLFPNTQYRFFVNGVENPALITFGAGNSIHYQDETTLYHYSSTKSLVSTNTPPDYSSFTTGAGENSKKIWVNILPTGNARFAEGNNIWWRTFITDNPTGLPDTLTSSSSSRCLEFGNFSAHATGIFDENSGMAQKNYVCLFDNEAGSGNPVSTAMVQEDGTAIFRTFGTNGAVTTQAVGFYENTDNKAGGWATLIPNNLNGGVKRLEERSADGEVVRYWTDADGIWSGVNTVRTTRGVNAIAFETPQISIVFPNSTQSFCAGDLLNIGWISRGVTSVKVELSRNNGPYIPVSDSAYSPAGFYSWIIRQADDSSKNYRIRITDAEHNTAISLSQPFSIYLPPTVIVQPRSANRCYGDTMTISVGISGTVQSVQWQKDGQDIPGANSRSLRFLNGNAGHSGLYSCKIRGLGACREITTDTVVAFFTPTLVILKQPTDVSAALGKKAMLSVEIMGTEDHQYQWFRGNEQLTNGIRYSGVNSSTLIINEISSPDYSDRYFCRITGKGTCGTVVTRFATIRRSQISIVSQPDSNVTLCEGVPTALSVNATVAPIGILFYKWYKNNMPIENSATIQGTESNTLFFSNPVVSDTGVYVLQITSEGQDVNFSNNIVVAISSKPVLENETQMITACQGELVALNTKLIDSIAATTYSWSVNNRELPIVAGPSFAFRSMRRGVSDTIRAIARNKCGQDTVTVAIIQTPDLPFIVKQPEAKTEIPTGNAIRLAVSAYSDIEMRYQWYKNNTELLGAISPLYLKVQAQQSDGGQYFCLLRTQCDTISTDTVEVVVKGITSAEESDVEYINVYPNPANETLSIRAAFLAGVRTIVILDLYGRTVWSTTYRSNTETIHIPLSQFESGRFTLLLDNGSMSKYIPFSIVK